MNLDFLKGVTLEPVTESKNAGKRSTGTPHLPDGLAFRLFKSGRIYASKELAAKYTLQFAERVETPDPMTGNVISRTPGHGVDFFGSKNWGMLKDSTTPVMFVGFVPREGNTKIDLWASTKYSKETGKPISDIFEQGVATFAKKTLVSMIAEYYPYIDWDKVNYVDIDVVMDCPMVSPNGVYHIPKTITRGDNEGKPSYARRENIEIYAIMAREPSVKDPEVQKDTMAQAERPAHQESPEDPIAQAEEIMKEADKHYADTTQEDDLKGLL